MDLQYTYKHLDSKELKRLAKWLDKSNESYNSGWIPWHQILTPSDDSNYGRRKAIDESRVASAQRYARESRIGKSSRSRYGSKKREVNQVSRKKLQEQEKNKRIG